MCLQYEPLQLFLLTANMKKNKFFKRHKSQTAKLPLLVLQEKSSKLQHFRIWDGELSPPSVWAKEKNRQSPNEQSKVAICPSI